MLGNRQDRLLLVALALEEADYQEVERGNHQGLLVVEEQESHQARLLEAVSLTFDQFLLAKSGWLVAVRESRRDHQQRGEAE